MDSEDTESIVVERDRESLAERFERTGQHGSGYYTAPSYHSSYPLPRTPPPFSASGPPPRNPPSYYPSYSSYSTPEGPRYNPFAPIDTNWNYAPPGPPPPPSPYPRPDSRSHSHPRPPPTVPTPPPAPTYTPPRRPTFPLGRGQGPPPPQPNPFQPPQYWPPPGPLPRQHFSSRPRTPIIPVDLQERPENLVFATRSALHQRMVSTFRPLVGIIGRLVKDQLRLQDQPQVRFDMYPVRVDRGTGSPRLLSRDATAASGPVYQITLPGPGFTRQALQDVADALKDAATLHANPWYTQAGYVFRVSRRGWSSTRPVRRVRYWVPPACIYVFSHRDRYRARYVEPSRENVVALENTQDYGDESLDDQDDLVEDMWADVRTRSAQGYRVGTGMGWDG